ncbi:hypothetical protein CKAH01_02969 [Colletotrichum kahawae]|uniref:Uncharacterized protein n=1 Tax=Colletotrichum kahawae TaxID=34407 RepID=A0AAD9YU01_COLKA|nr:hypothetical protein CKAH01_02969 [Colletotrichum kahawae]
MRSMCSSGATLLPFLFHLALAAPRISPREDGCGVGVTGLPSITYTMMAPVQTIVIDMAQEDGCPWIKAEIAPTLALPIASPSASNPGPSLVSNIGQNPGSNVPANAPNQGATAGILPDGAIPNPSATAISGGSPPAASPNGGGPPQPLAGPGATGPIDGDGGFSQNIPTGPANNPDSATQTQGGSPTTLVGSPTESPPPRFVIYAGSTHRAFELPYLGHSQLSIGVLALWGFIMLDVW